MKRLAAFHLASLSFAFLASSLHAQLSVPTTTRAAPNQRTSDSALVANFPAPVGAARKSFTSNRHSGGAWQEAALYTVAGPPDAVAKGYAEQIVGAGWSASSISSSGAVGTATYRAVQDFTAGPSKAHIVIAPDAKLGLTVTTTITTNFPAGTTPSLSLDVTATPSTGATSSPADQGAADPANFPRLPGSVRSFYQASASAGSQREDARYAASGGVGNAEAFFTGQLVQMQWSETYRFIGIDDVSQTTKVENTWQTSGGNAGLTLSSAASGGINVLVAVTRTTPTVTAAQPLNLPGAAAGAAITSPPSTPTNAPPPVKSSLMPPSPAITGLTVQSSSPVAHTLQWDCAKDEWVCGNSGKITAAGSTPNIPIFDYALSSKAPGASQFDPVNPTSPIAAFGDCVNPPTCTQGVLHVKASITAYIAPNTTLRVVRTDRQGKLAPANADFVYASPPLPQEPTAFTATESQFGEVKLTWTPVAGPTVYLISDKGSTAPPAQVANQSTTYPSAMLFKNVSPGSHTYQIASGYGYPLPAVNLPEASVLVHRVPPPRGVPFLTKNNGAGSEGSSAQHLAYFGVMNGALIACPGDSVCADTTKPIKMTDYLGFTGVPLNGTAMYANVTELALGRSVKCWENIDPTTLSGLGSIDCLAGNHGALVGPATPNVPDLTASAADGSTFAAVWMHFDVPRRLMTFGNFLPENGGTLPDPNTTGKYDGWKSARAATLDGEGAKYLPHVCLPCHGGTFQADTGAVTRATFLPVDPSLVAFSTLSNYNRATFEEGIRQINAMIMDSNPPQPVADYINGLYKGNAPRAVVGQYLPVQAPGAVAQASYVPDGWAQQADFFKTVVKPNCLMCHLATSSPTLVFDSAAKFFANKALLYAAVCVGRSMPNAELPYNNLWTSVGPSGTVNDGPAARLFAALGHNGCP